MILTVYLFIYSCKDLRRQIYLACDDAALTREEICRATLQSGLFENADMPNVCIKN
jgi:hypothetical protein